MKAFIKLKNFLGFILIIFSIEVHTLERLKYIDRVNSLGCLEEIHKNLYQMENAISSYLKCTGKENNICIGGITLLNKGLILKQFYIYQTPSNNIEISNIEENSEKNVTVFESGRKHIEMQGLTYHPLNTIIKLQQDSIKFIYHKFLIDWLETHISNSNNSILISKIREAISRTENINNIQIDILNNIQTLINNINLSSTFLISTIQEKESLLIASPENLEKIIYLEEKQNSNMKTLLDYIEIYKQANDDYKSIIQDYTMLMTEHLYHHHWHSEQRLMYILHLFYKPIIKQLDTKSGYAISEAQESSGLCVIFNIHTRLGPCEFCTGSFESFLASIEGAGKKIPLFLSISYKDSYDPPYYPQNEENQMINAHNKAMLGIASPYISNILTELNKLHDNLNRQKNAIELINDLIQLYTTSKKDHSENLDRKKQYTEGHLNKSYFKYNKKEIDNTIKEIFNNNKLISKTGLEILKLENKQRALLNKLSKKQEKLKSEHFHETREYLTRRIDNINHKQHILNNKALKSKESLKNLNLIQEKLLSKKASFVATHRERKNERLPEKPATEAKELDKAMFNKPDLLLLSETISIHNSTISIIMTNLHGIFKHKKELDQVLGSLDNHLKFASTLDPHSYLQEGIIPLFHLYNNEITIYNFNNTFDILYFWFERATSKYIKYKEKEENARKEKNPDLDKFIKRTKDTYSSLNHLLSLEKHWQEIKSTKEKMKEIKIMIQNLVNVMELCLPIQKENHSMPYETNQVETKETVDWIALSQDPNPTKRVFIKKIIEQENTPSS